MTNFNGKLISNTYRSLLTVNASVTGTGVATSLTNVQTADGTQTALRIATNSVHINGAFAVSGATSLASGLHVADKVCASAFFGDGSNLTGLTASIGGSISVGNALIDGVVTVTGNAVFESDVSVSGDRNVATNGRRGTRIYCQVIPGNYQGVAKRFNQSGKSLQRCFSILTRREGIAQG
jgi:hypothetical protein